MTSRRILTQAFTVVHLLVTRPLLIVPESTSGDIERNDTSVAEGPSKSGLVELEPSVLGASSSITLYVKLLIPCIELSSDDDERIFY